MLPGCSHPLAPPSKYHTPFYILAHLDGLIIEYEVVSYVNCIPPFRTCVHTLSADFCFCILKLISRDI